MKQNIRQRIADIRRGNVPAGYKRTNSGIIPIEWQTPELNCVLSENKERNRSGRFGKDDVLSVSGEFGVTNQIELLGRSFAGVSVKDYHVVESGNIVYTKSPLKSNPYGIIKLNKGKAGIVSTLYAVYNCTSHKIGTYLDYYFSIDRNVNRYLRPLVRKGTKNDMKINNEEVLNGRIILPPVAEITKIVEILGCCDRMIALKKELITEKKKQKKALMQKLLNPDSGFRLPGFTGEWKKTTLGELSTQNGDYGINAPACPFSPNLPRYIRITDIDEHCKFTKQNNVCVNAPNSVDYTLHESDIVFVRTGGTVGKSYVYNPVDGELVFAGFLIRFHFASPKSDCNFIKQIVSTDKYFKWVNVISARSGQPGINAEEYASYSFFSPILPEQRAIAEVLSAADKEIDMLEQELAQQLQKKKSLMQLLLTGIVRA